MKDRSIDALASGAPDSCVAGPAPARAIVEGGSELVARFAALTDDVHGGAPGCPTSGHIAALLDETHPQRRRSSLRLFQVEGSARVAAIVNPRLVEGGAPVGLLGFFEAHDDEDAARAVLAAAAAWLRERGCRVIRGPVNYSTWNDYRLTTTVTEPGGIPGEPRNPLYYSRLWERAGFRVASRYASHWIPSNEAVLARWAAKMEAARAAGVALRPISAGDLPSVYQLAIAGFADAYMYSPLEPDEFAAMYTADRAAAVGTHAYLATLEDRPVGFFYGFTTTLPSGPTGVLKTVTIAREARDRGAYHLLMGAALRAFTDAGIGRAIAALMHTDGAPALMGWTRPEYPLYKQYALYELAA